jgi:hypothetical protein
MAPGVREPPRGAGPGWESKDVAAHLVHIPSSGQRANPSLKVRTSVSPPLLNVKPGSPYTQEHAHPTQNDFTARTLPRIRTPMFRPFRSRDLIGLAFAQGMAGKKPKTKRHRGLAGTVRLASPAGTASI